MNLLHEVLNEVFEKVLYSVYYQIRDEKQNAPSYFQISFDNQHKFKNTTE